jgi:hypothetical protein
MNIYFLDNFNKKSRLNVISFFIGHFSRENYVAIRFSPPQRRKNQTIAFVFLH